MKLLLNLVILLLLLAVIGVVVVYLLAPKTSPESFLSYFQKLPLRLAQAHLTDAKARKILALPASNALISEKQKYFDFVDSNSISTGTINFKNCLPAPLAAKMRQGKVFKAVNPDSVVHEIKFDQTYSYKLEAKKTTEITASFGRDGVVGYTCDNSPIVGVILVTRGE